MLLINQNRMRLPSISKLVAMAIFTYVAIFTHTVTSYELARANGLSHDIAEEVFSGPVGPYSASIYTVPEAGNLHFTIFLQMPDGDMQVQDGNISLSGTGPTNGPIHLGQNVVRHSQANSNWFSVDLTAKESGTWLFILTANGDPGEGTVEFSVTLREPESINWLVLGAIMGFVALAVWSVISWQKDRSKIAKV